MVTAESAMLKVGQRVEDGEWEKAEPDFEEVGDGAVDDAVREIARRAAEKECESRGVDGAGIAAGHEQPGDEGDDQQRADNQYDCELRFPWSWRKN